MGSHRGLEEFEHWEWRVGWVKLAAGGLGRMFNPAVCSEVFGELSLRGVRAAGAG